MVIIHEPGWSANGGHANNSAIHSVYEPFFEQNQVALVMAGHNHYYARAMVNGIPELTIYPGATGMVIAPGMVRFTAPLDLQAMVQFYAHIMSDAGWKPSPGYSLDTPQLYFQEWDKGEESLRFNISSPGSSVQSSLVSIQCLQCTAP